MLLIKNLWHMKHILLLKTDGKMLLANTLNIHTMK